MMMILEGVWDHIPPAVLAGLAGITVTIALYAAKARREEGQALGKSEVLQERHASELNAIWKRVDELRKDIDETRERVVVLQVNVSNLPSRDILDQKIRELENRLDKRLTEAVAQIEKALSDGLKRASDSWECPKERAKL